LVLAAHVLLVGRAAAADGTGDSQAIERLEQLVKDQQAQLESMQRQLDQLKTGLQPAERGVPSPPEQVVTSGQKRVRLAISGQVNRAVNVADDGKNTAAYFVDSASSNTRVRFVGTAEATEDLTIGSRLELSLAPNESSEVSQDNEESGDYSDQRWAEISLASKRFGKLSLGKGDTASNNTAEVDLSKTDVVQYASIADIAGGMLFRQTGDDALTGVRMSDAFKDFDGLSRRSRVRYDTPTFHGFSLAASLISDQRYDASLWWGGQGLGFKAAAAVAIANPNEDDTDLQYDGSFSLLHEATGLNLTFSAGVKERDNQGNPSNLWGKLGWLTRFFSAGQTAFAVDYGKTVNLPTGTDEGYSVGAAAVQQFEEFGTELYLQYRLFSLDRDTEPSVQDMDVVSAGARVKF